MKRAVSARQFPAGGDKPGCARRVGSGWVHARPRRGRRDGERSQLVLIATVNEIYLGPQCCPCAPRGASGGFVLLVPAAGTGLGPPFSTLPALPPPPSSPKTPSPTLLAVLPAGKAPACPETSHFPLALLKELLLEGAHHQKSPLCHPGQSQHPCCVPPSPSPCGLPSLKTPGKHPLLLPETKCPL